GVRRSERLIRPLLGCALPDRRACPAQSVVQTRGDRQVLAGKDADDSRDLPTRYQSMQRSIGKLWRRIDCRKVEILAPVQFTVSAIQPPPVRQPSYNKVPHIAVVDAVRQGVVRK